MVELLGSKVGLIMLIAIVVPILQAICLFGTTPYLLKNSTYDIKIDTRKATVTDILGGIKINDPSSNSKAVDYLNDVKSIMNDLVEDSVDKDSENKFSVAQAFGFNEFIEHGINGYRCWSSKPSSHLGAKDYHIESSKAVRDACSMGGFMRCLGRPVEASSHTSSIYTLNGDYIDAKTGYSSSNLTDKWSYVMDHVDESSLIINVSPQSLSELKKLSCSSDPFSKNNDKSVKASITWILGLISFVAPICFSFASPFSATFALTFMIQSHIIRLVFWTAAFGYNQSIISSSTKRLLSSSEGLKVHGTLYNSGGSGAFFIVVLILELCIPVLTVLLYIDSMKELNEVTPMFTAFIEPSPHSSPTIAPTDQEHVEGRIEELDGNTGGSTEKTAEQTAETAVGENNKEVGQSAEGAAADAWVAAFLKAVDGPPRR